MKTRLFWLGDRAPVSAVGLGLILGGATGNALAWNEVGDAPDGIAGMVQVVDSSQGPLVTSITGATSAASDDFVDAYLISINNSAIFEATTVGGAGFDTILFLFDATGFGRVANDDATGATSQSRLVAMSNDGTGISVGPGNYILAIAGFQLDPVDAMGRELFEIVNPFLEVSGPDGPGGNDPLSAWVDNTVQGTAATGGYVISLTGVGPVPAPGSAFMLAAALTMFARRTRQS